MLPPQPPQEAASVSVETSWKAVWEDCARRTARKYEGWFVLSENSSFIVCPSCFDASIRHTPLCNRFKYVQSLSNSQYSCDFGDLITRIAWIFILLNKDNGPSALDTLVYLCKQRSTSQCPNFSAQLKGTEMALKHIKTPATCCWYSVANADGKPMTDFTICPQCRAEVEYLLQTYKGWQPSSEVQNKFILAALEPCQATCSFIHGHRMWNYLQAIFLNDTPENFRDLAKLIDERACLAECREGVMAYGMYISLNNASCIVACEECAMDVIMPDIERGVLRWDQLSRYDGSKNGFSCSLKEARVRQL